MRTLVDVILAIGALAVGLVVLVKAADVFVGAAEGVALHLRWSPAVIGAVVVGFGTSLPELVTSVLAAFAGEPDLAIGNAAGSNVANLSLVLGLAAVVAPLRGERGGSLAGGRDVLLAGGAGLVLVGLAADGRLGWFDAAVLLLLLLTTVGWQASTGRTERLEVATEVPVGRLWLRVVLGLVGVVVGAQLLVHGATVVATTLGVPTIIVGSVLVAVGTSLPELATAVASARRGQTDLLVGNLLGSNAFNALAVVGSAALVGAARGDQLLVATPALAVVVAGGVVTVAVGVWLWRVRRLSRVAGILLLGAYAASIPALAALS